MNSSSNLPIFTSKENLTTRFTDYSNVYLLPSICLFGIITNTFCIIVSFKRDESNAKILDYIFLNSLVDFSFLLIQSFLFIIRCGVLCPYGNTFMAKFYEVYIYLYVGYVLVTAQILLNIYVTYDRLKMFSGKLSNRKQLTVYQIYGICVIISIFANLLPYPIAREVVPIGILRPNPNSSYSEVLFVRVYRKEFQTLVMQNVLTGVLIVKNPILLSVLCFVSTLVCFRFRNFLKARHTLIKRVITGKYFFLNFFLTLSLYNFDFK